jgi:hypothetical protein
MAKLDYKNFALYLFVCAIILTPLLVYPLSGDLGLFLTGVKAMNRGDLPYAQIFDIKAPAVFYIYQGICSIFGTGERGIRLFDFIIQLITISSGYLLIFNISKDKFKALAYGVLYSLAYVILNFNNTTQIESYLGLAIIPAIYLQIKKPDSKIGYAILGAIIGIFTGMKYTLGIMLPALILDDLIRLKLKPLDIIRKNYTLWGAFILVFAATLTPYLNSEIYTGFKKTQDYFQFYAGQPKPNSEAFKYVLKSLSDYFGDIQSIAYILMFASGLGYLFNKNSKANEGEKSLLSVAFIFASFLLIACFVERKLFIYHLSRMNSALALFWAFGFVEIFRNAKIAWRESVINKYAIGFIGLFLLLLSPLPRFVKIIDLPYLYFTNTEKYDERYQIEGNDAIARQTHKAVAEYINSRTKPSDPVLCGATGAGVLTYMLNTERPSKFYQSSFYVYPGNIERDSKEFANELKTAKYAIFQTNDKHLYVNGSYFSTYENITNNSIIWNVISEYYSKDTIIKNFIIYRNIKCAR